VIPGLVGRLKGVWCHSANAVFAVGDDDLLKKGPGDKWVLQSGDLTQEYYCDAVHGSSDDYVLAIADDIVLKFDGGQWTAKWGIPDSSSTRGFNDLWVLSELDSFIAGDGGEIFHLDSTSLSALTNMTVTKPNPQNLESIWVDAGGTFGFAGGWYGELLQFDGAAWSDAGAGLTEYVMDIFGFSPASVYAVADKKVLHYNGTAWSVALDAPIFGFFQEIWGDSETNIYAVGSDEALYHYDGVQWSYIDLYSTLDPLGLWSDINFNAVWGNSAGEVVIGGSTTGFYLPGSIIARYNGQEWKMEWFRGSGMGNRIESIWISPAGKEYTTQANSVLMHREPVPMM